MFAGQFRQDLIETLLVVIINETVMEYTQCLVTEKTEDLYLITDDSHISPKDTLMKNADRYRETIMQESTLKTVNKYKLSDFFSIIHLNYALNTCHTLHTV